MTNKTYSRWFVAVALGCMLWVLLGCTGSGVTLTRWDGSSIQGKLIVGDFESEEIVIQDADGQEITVRFSEIKRIEMGKRSR